MDVKKIFRTTCLSKEVSEEYFAKKAESIAGIVNKRLIWHFELNVKIEWKQDSPWFNAVNMIIQILL